MDWHFLLRKIGRHPVMAAFAVMGSLILVIVIVLSIAPKSYYQVDAEVNYSPEDRVVEVMHESSPQRLQIPKLNIDTTFSASLGLNEQKEIEVPEEYDQVGWYKFGPTPGEIGPAVILGHVDSVDGPAVFYSLGKLEAGDRIYVDREDGSTAEFEVTSLQRVSQDNFPTEEVYGKIDYAGLRLITCSGKYDKVTKRYSNNLIVYAKLLDTYPAN